MSKKNKNKKRQIIAMLLGLFSMGKIGFKQEAHFTSAISNSVKTDKNIFSLKNNEQNKLRLQDDFYTSINEEWLKNGSCTKVV